MIVLKCQNVYVSSRNKAPYFTHKSKNNAFEIPEDTHVELAFRVGLQIDTGISSQNHTL